MQTSLATLEEHDRTDTLDSVGDSQLSYSADTESFFFFFLIIIYVTNGQKQHDIA